MRAAICLLLFGSASAIAANPISAGDRKLIVTALRERADARVKIATLNRQLADQLRHATEGVVDKKLKESVWPESPDKKTPVRFPTKAQKDAKIKELSDDVKRLTDHLARTAPKQAADLADPLTLTTTKEVGPLPHLKVKVAEVVSETSAIILTRTNPENAARNQPVQVFISGIDTSKYADGLMIDRPAGLFWVVGNKKVGGATYLHLVPVTLTDEEAKGLMAAANPEKKP